jgi:hypothetical protein
MAELPEPDLTDPDNPEWTEETFARAVPVDDLPPHLQAAILAALPRTKLRQAEGADKGSGDAAPRSRHLGALPRHGDRVAIQDQCGPEGDCGGEAGLRVDAASAQPCP